MLHCCLYCWQLAFDTFVVEHVQLYQQRWPGHVCYYIWFITISHRYVSHTWIVVVRFSFRDFFLFEFVEQELEYDSILVFSSFFSPFSIEYIFIANQLWLIIYDSLWIMINRLISTCFLAIISFLPYIFPSSDKIIFLLPHGGYIWSDSLNACSISADQTPSSSFRSGL